jgi:hypothetical protein
MYQYAPPAIGCAVANYVGNQAVERGDNMLAAVAVVIILAVIGYILYVLKPFNQAH